MSTNYPGAIDSFTTKQDGVDVVVASHVNNLQDPVVAIETELGTNPKGSYTDVGAAIAAKVSKAGDTLTGDLAADAGVKVDGVDISAHTHTGGSGDAPNIPISSVTDLQSSLDAKLDLSGGTMTGELVLDDEGLGTTVMDGASAIGFKLDTPSYTTSGAKLLSVQNNATEKFAVDKDGKIVSGTIDESSINDGSILARVASNETISGAWNFTSDLGLDTSSPTAQLDINSNLIRLRSSKTPSSASDTGNAGDICWDSNYIYICVATDTWKRTAISTWS